MERIHVSNQANEPEIPIDCFNCSQFVDCVRELRDDCRIIRQRNEVRKSEVTKRHVVKGIILAIVVLITSVAVFTTIVNLESKSLALLLLLTWVLVNAFTATVLFEGEELI